MPSPISINSQAGSFSIAFCKSTSDAEKPDCRLGVAIWGASPNKSSIAKGKAKKGTVDTVPF